MGIKKTTCVTQFSLLDSIPNLVRDLVPKTKPPAAKKVASDPSPARKMAAFIFGRNYDRWPKGHHRARGCDCCIDIDLHGNSCFTPCSEHESVSQANFGDKPTWWLTQEQLQIEQNAKFDRLPRTEVPAAYQSLLTKLFIPWNWQSFGDPKNFKKQDCSLEPPYNCGCRFVAKPLTFGAIWSDEAEFWITKSRTVWLAVKVVPCDGADGECKCSSFQKYSPNVQLRRVLNKALKEQST